MTIEDYVNYHNEHCPIHAEHGICACWLPEKTD